MRRTTRLFLLASALFLVGCPDDGERLDLCANPALDCDDGNACTVDSCDAATGCVHSALACGDGDVCTADSCDPASGCVNEPLPCNDGNACTADACDAERGCTSTDISASCDDGSACTIDSCDPASGCRNVAVNCDDGNACTADSCDAATGCASVAVADGTPCDSGLGRCTAGVCERLACFADGDCNDGNACTADRCNLAANECVNTDVSADCDDDDACTADSCNPASGCVNTDISASCDDGEECTAESCDAATGCASEPVANGTVCDGGAGRCNAGVCQSLNIVEYRQDFEALDRTDVRALADDGWLVFGNVYDPADQSFLYGYGPFIAPNDGAAFSAIVADQGGAPQGSQQLSIYSDYNNADHANGRLIESLVFRERILAAADVGRTVSFAFDAKRGNINDPSDPLCPCTSTAYAFVKTLDPASGFATTNLVQQDTTALPESWSRLTITLPIDAGLVGQLLQVGFATTATRYQPSANVYDNLELANRPTVAE